MAMTNSFNSLLKYIFSQHVIRMRHVVYKAPWQQQSQVVDICLHQH